MSLELQKCPKLQYVLPNQHAKFQPNQSKLFCDHGNYSQDVLWGNFWGAQDVLWGNFWGAQDVSQIVAITMQNLLRAPHVVSQKSPSKDAPRMP